MKKVILLVFAIIVVCFLFYPNKKEIRVRVISNSDNLEDIYYKELVVEYLINDVFDGVELTDKYFKENYLDIENELNTVFENIKVKYEKHQFKNKMDHSNAIKDEQYMTLVVYIGEANGHNWWGTIFEGALKNETQQEVVYEWYYKKLF